MYKYKTWISPGLIMVIILLGSCIGRHRSIRQVNSMIASYDTLTRDTTLLFCADTSMTKFCITVDYYISNNTLRKVVVTGDESLERRTAIYYYSYGDGLVKSVGSTGPGMKSEIHYFRDGSYSERKRRKDDSYMPFSNESDFVWRIYSEDIYPVLNTDSTNK